MLKKSKGIFMTRLSILILLFSTVIVSAQENIWLYKTKRDLMADRMVFIGSTEKKFSYAISSDVKTPDGDNTLEVKILKTEDKANTYSKQINYRYNKGLKQGQKIKVSFYYKGNMEGQISTTFAMAFAPFKTIGTPSGKTLNVSNEWQKEEFVFTVTNDFDAPSALPRLMFGTYPENGLIYLGPVKMEILENTLPLSLNESWDLLRIAQNDDIPEYPSESTQKIQLKNERIDLALDSTEKKKVAILYNEFNSDDSGIMKVGMAADWWFECYVNGKKVYDTLKSGNVSHRFSPLDHIFSFPVKKGKNIMIVKVIAGSEGFVFSAGKVPYNVKSSAVEMLTIKESRDWKAINTKKLTINKGTALDFSGIVDTGAPAGIYGRVIINNKGKLALASKPEKSIRLFGFNTWQCDHLNYWSKQDIEQFAADMATQGYNHIRIQGVGNILMGGEKRWGLWGVKMNRSIETALLDDELPFIESSFDKFDYLLSCLKKNGIYYNLDILHINTGCLVVNPKIPYAKGFRIQLLFNAEYRKHWQKVFQYILTHRNPYTGQVLKDDPALMCVEFFNEQDFLAYKKDGIKELSPLFLNYLRNKYNNITALNQAWGKTFANFEDVPDFNNGMLTSGDNITKDAGDFLINIMSETTDWYFKQIREIGYTGIVCQWDMIMRMLDLPIRAKMPITVQHSYLSHPNNIPTKNLVPKTENKSLPLKFMNNVSQDTRVYHVSSINSSYIRASAAFRFIDRPFMLTEYSQCFFSSYRHEQGLYVSAYAALQDWDGMLHHGSPVLANIYNNGSLTHAPAADPILRASEVITTLAWLRKDVKTSPHLVSLNLEAKNIFPEYTIAAIGDDYAKLAMITGIGISYPSVKPLMPVGTVNPDIVLEPKEFTKINIQERWAANSSADGSVFVKLIEKLKEKSIIPENNATNYSQRIFQSDTNEITLFGLTNSMTVKTPLLEGAILNKSSKCNIGSMNILSSSKPCSIVLASLNKDKNISATEKMLLIISTNALNSNTVLAEGGALMIDKGTSPVLMETVRVNLYIKTKQTTKPNVYALNLDGTREEQIDCTFNNGILALNFDTSKLKYATPFFEIVY